MNKYFIEDCKEFAEMIVNKFIGDMQPFMESCIEWSESVNEYVKNLKNFLKMVFGERMPIKLFCYELRNGDLRRVLNKISERDVIFSSTDLVGYLAYWNINKRELVINFEMMLENIKCKIEYSKDLKVIGDIRNGIMEEVIPILVHEIRHLYDDIISDGKFITDKKSKRFYGKQYKTLEEKRKLYLNLPHEIWARFNAAVILMDWNVNTFKEYLENFDKFFKFPYEENKYHTLKDLSKNNKKRIIGLLGRNFLSKND